MSEPNSELSIDDSVARMIVETCMTGDQECDHSKADDILCDLLRILGYEKTVAAWDQVDKWYA